MSVTPYSVLMSILCSDIFIVILYILRKKKILARYDGIFIILALYTLTFLRLFIPVEFNFVKIIHAPAVLNPVQRTLQRPILMEGWTVLTLLYAIWIIIAIFLIIRHLSLYFRVTGMLLGMPDARDARYRAYLEKINNRYGKQVKVNFRVSNIAGVPMGFGIRKFVILLPNHEYSDDQLYYILLHEFNHFYNHDILVKLLTKLFCCLFWWNPVAYLLSVELENTLEIKCDLTSTALLSKKEKIGYLETILECLKKTIADSKKLFRCSTALFHTDRMDLLPERMTAITKRGTRKSCIFKLTLLVFVFALIYLSSYALVFQPYIPLSGQLRKNMDIVSPEHDAYITVDEYGNYFLILEGTDIKVSISKDNAELYLSNGIATKKGGMDQ